LQKLKQLFQQILHHKETLYQHHFVQKHFLKRIKSNITVLHKEPSENYIIMATLYNTVLADIIISN